MLKFIDREPATAEADSEPEERNLTRVDIAQAMVEAFAIVANTDPARLSGAVRADAASTPAQWREKEKVKVKSTERTGPIRTGGSDDGLYDWAPWPVAAASPTPTTDWDLSPATKSTKNSKPS